MSVSVSVTKTRPDNVSANGNGVPETGELTIKPGQTEKTRATPPGRSRNLVTAETPVKRRASDLPADQRSEVSPSGNVGNSLVSGTPVKRVYTKQTDGRPQQLSVTAPAEKESDLERELNRNLRNQP